MASSAIEFKADLPRSGLTRAFYAEGALAWDASVRIPEEFAARLGAFALLLHRLTGQTEGRFAFAEGDAAARLVGFAAGSPCDFSEWTDRIRAEVSASGAVADEPGVVVFSAGPREFPNDLTVWASASGLGARYRADLFSAGRIGALLGQLRQLLVEVTADPSRDIADYSLVTPEARAYLPDPTFALEAPDYPPLIEAVAAHGRQFPGAPAVEQGSRVWTYDDLDAVSAWVARSLLAGGLVAGDRVVLTGPRSFGFIASMLGVWRAAGVLVNIDPSLPEQRQRLMAETAQATFLVLIADPGSAGPVLGTGFRALVTIGPDGTFPREAADPKNPSAPLPTVCSSDPAYIFFTSGSTGVPKAVHGRHAGLSQFLTWQRTRFGIGPGDRASQLTALSFDVILRDSFMVLTAGGTLCIPGEYDVLDPARIITWLRQKRITVLHVVPSLARLWLKSLPSGQEPLPLRHVFFAGEPLTDVLVSEWKASFAPQAEIVNLYGPTETTLAKCFFVVGNEVEPGVQSIGGPIPHCQVLILNSRRQLCGLNEPGEIAIRTPFRTFGYFQNPEATAKVFVPNPFRDDPEDLIYLTGDGGSYRTDGRLSIHGRLDNQVKIRGIRVEPGEIEAQLAKNEFVRDVAIVTQLDPAGEKALVAYVVLREPCEAGREREWTVRLREYLKAVVPVAMVPGAFLILDSLPLNPNGKVNRQVLPRPDERAFASADFVEPVTELEVGLAAIWRQILHREQVGIDDDFFDLGGHSLLAVQLIQEAKASLGCQITIPLLFQTRTIRKLAQKLTSAGGDLSEAAVLPLQPEGTGPVLFCLAGLHLYQELADQLAPDIPVCGVFLPIEEQLLNNGPESSSPSTIEDWAAAYKDAIRNKQPHGPYLLCGVSFGGVMAYEVGVQFEREGEVVGFVGMLDSRLPSATRRNWVRWGIHQGRRFFLGEGWRSLVKRLGLVSRAGGDVAESEGVVVHKLEKKRQDYFRVAELAYHPSVSDNPVLLVKAQTRTFADYDLGDASYGWGKYSRNFTTTEAPGDHLGILKGVNATVLAATLRPFLEAAKNSVARQGSPS